MCLNKLPLLKGVREGPSWHKILKILQRAAIQIVPINRLLQPWSRWSSYLLQWSHLIWPFCFSNSLSALDVQKVIRKKIEKSNFCFNPPLPSVPFFTFWKHQKTYDFLFSGGIKREHQAVRAQIFTKLL